MRRMLFGLLTFGACAANAAVLAEELSAMDDFAASPLRKTLDPQVEIPPLALQDRRFDPRANAGGAAVIAALPADSTIFDRIGLHDGPIDPRSQRPTTEFANSDLVDPPFWANAPNNNFVGRKQNLNTLLGYPSVVEAAKFQGWFGAATQARIWRQDQENMRPNGGGLGTIWELDAAPSSQTMFFVRGFYSDLFQRSLVEIKPGYAVLDNFSFAALAPGKLYIGPFAVLTGHWRDKVSKAGLQMTFGEIGAFSLTFAAGVSRDKYAGVGAAAFGMIELSLRF